MTITKKTCAAILIAALPVVNSLAGESPATNSSWWKSWLSWLGVGQEEVKKLDDLSGYTKLEADTISAPVLANSGFE
ncbi:MAG: hypothetical protein ACKOEZ_03045, partial [Spartobacteria bacterium]